MICILGMGYVGLTLAVHLAERFPVVGVDIDPEQLKKLRHYEPPFSEAGLDVAMKNVRDRLTFSSEPIRCECYIICVGTPKNGTLEQVYRAAESIPNIGEATVVLRSTVPVGTTARLQKKYGGAWFFAPERTIEGRALEELKQHRQVYGAPTPFNSWNRDHWIEALFDRPKRLRTSNEAEAVKLIDNSWRDFIFAFANMVAIEGERRGFDAFAAIEAAREGYGRTNVPLPGWVGGPCLTKDPHILFDDPLSRKVHEGLIAHELKRAGFKGTLGVLGAAFKGVPFTSDTRDGPLSQVEAAAWYDPQIPGPYALEDVLNCDFVLVANNNPAWTRIKKGKGKIVDLWGLVPEADFTLGVPCTNT